jgi:hypothetical protein
MGTAKSGLYDYVTRTVQPAFLPLPAQAPYEMRPARSPVFPAAAERRRRRFFSPLFPRTCQLQVDHLYISEFVLGQAFGHIMSSSAFWTHMRDGKIRGVTRSSINERPSMMTTVIICR